MELKELMQLMHKVNTDYSTSPPFSFSSLSPRGLISLNGAI